MPKEPTLQMALTLDLIDQLVKEAPIDAKRIYVSGMSMGGFGTWDAIQRRPNFFAAAVPVCGGGDTAEAAKIKDVPPTMYFGVPRSYTALYAQMQTDEALKQAFFKRLKFIFTAAAALNQATYEGIKAMSAEVQGQPIPSSPPGAPRRPPPTQPTCTGRLTTLA